MSEIKLPPLPVPGEAMSKWAYDESDMKAYARTAVEVDRLRRGEPVGETFTMEPLDGSGDVRSHALLTRDLPAGTKLYTAPQSAEPVKGELTDDQITALQNAFDRGKWFGERHQGAQPADIDPAFVSDLARSRAKYPGNARMFDGLMGEVDELRRAYGGDGYIRAEALDVAVCAYRIATEGDAGGNMLLAQPAASAKPPELHGIANALAKGNGFWRSCSGCHELNEGHDTGPYSETLKCHLGNGCNECGGIGAIWDTTDYGAMGDFLMHDMAAPVAQKAVAWPELTDLGLIRVGNLPTMNQDEYPDLGDWWVQLRIGNDGDEVLARVYGDTPEQARNRAVALVAAQAQTSAEDREDAQRYRWLRNESWAGYNTGSSKPRVAETIVITQDGAGNVKTILAEDALDAAIDAARAAKGRP